MDDIDVATAGLDHALPTLEEALHRGGGAVVMQYVGIIVNELVGFLLLCLDIIPKQQKTY